MDKYKQKKFAMFTFYMACWAVLLLIAQGSYAEDKVTNLSNIKVGQQVGGDFSLINHNGKSFTLKSQRGKLVLIFFGYTYCPDICPTELSVLSKVLHSLKEEASKVTLLFISVDPERDTPKILKQYVPYYSPHLIGLTGSTEAIDKVTEAYHVQYKIHEHALGDKHYLVDHSANLYVIDGEGELVNIIPFGLPVEHIKRIINNGLSKLK